MSIKTCVKITKYNNNNFLVWYYPLPPTPPLIAPRYAYTEASTQIRVCFECARTGDACAVKSEEKYVANKFPDDFAAIFFSHDFCSKFFSSTHTHWWIFLRFLSNQMEHDRGDNFPFSFEPKERKTVTTIIFHSIWNQFLCVEGRNFLGIWLHQTDFGFWCILFPIDLTPNVTF